MTTTELVAKLDQLRAERRWISVEEQLPEPILGDILVHRWVDVDSGIIMVLSDGEKFLNWPLQATHWMILPELPLI